MAGARVKRKHVKVAYQYARFIDEYLIDYNATAACIRAGYPAKNAKSTGHRLIHHPTIVAMLEEAMAERSMRTRITADRVLEELARVAFADPGTMYDPETGRMLPISDMPERVKSAISAISVGDGGEVRKVKLADKLMALKELAKHLGICADAPAAAAQPVQVVIVTKTEAK